MSNTAEVEQAAREIIEHFTSDGNRQLAEALRKAAEARVKQLDKDDVFHRALRQSAA